MKSSIYTLGEIAEITMGQSPPSDTYNTQKIGLPFFQGKAEFGEEHPIPVKWCSAPLRIAEVGDILLTVRAPVGPTNIASEKCCIGRGLASIRAKPEFALTRYLRFFFKYFEEEIASKGVGSTFTAINRNDISRLKITLPSLPEQERIVRLLDEAESIRAARVHANSRMKQFVPALFQEMFGDPVENKNGWQVVTIEETLDLINGRAFKPSDWKKEGIPIIRIQNLHDQLAPYNYYDKSFDEKYRVEPGDLLLSWSGQLVSFGVHVWTGLSGVLNQHIFNVKPKIPFEYTYLREALAHVVETSKQNFHGIEMKHLTKSTLNSKSFLKPPLALQREFAARVEAARGVQSAQGRSTERVEALYQSMLSRAFAGEL